MFQIYANKKTLTSEKITASLEEPFFILYKTNHSQLWDLLPSPTLSLQVSPLPRLSL